jgi:hypothetical protein
MIAWLALLPVVIPPPIPHDLTMRKPAAPPPAARPRQAPLPARWSVADRVTVRFLLQQGIEQLQPSGAPRGSGAELGVGDRKTAYLTLGQVVVGERGLGLEPLGIYLAGQFRFSQQGHSAQSNPIASAYDPSGGREAILVRHAWAEATGKTWRLRAGRQDRLGFAAVRFDGISATWNPPHVELAGFWGQRVSLWRGELGTSEAASDLAPLDEGQVGGARLAVGGAVVRGDVETIVARDQTALELGLELHRGARDRLRLSTRLQGLELARSALTWRHVSGSDRGLFTLDLEHTTPEAWRYDLVVRGRPAGDAFARYLDLGPEASLLRLRATWSLAFWQNLDLVVHGGGTMSLGDDAGTPAEDRALEAGVGGEVRLTSGFDALFMLSTRLMLPGERPAAPLAPATLPAYAASSGQGDVTDIVIGLRYGLGIKRFTAGFDYIARLVGDRKLDELLAVDPAHELISAFRFHVEAWVTANVRCEADYEVAGTPNFRAPDLRGVQRLRLGVEARF